jgi:hypothetical protein
MALRCGNVNNMDLPVCATDSYTNAQQVYLHRDERFVKIFSPRDEHTIQLKRGI